MNPFIVGVVGLAAIVAAAFVGWGELVGSLTLALVGVALVVLAVAAAEPWKGGRDGQVG